MGLNNGQVQDDSPSSISILVGCKKKKKKVSKKQKRLVVTVQYLFNRKITTIILKHNVLQYFCDIFILPIRVLTKPYFRDLEWTDCSLDMKMVKDLHDGYLKRHLLNMAIELKSIS